MKHFVFSMFAIIFLFFFVIFLYLEKERYHHGDKDIQTHGQNSDTLYIHYKPKQKPQYYKPQFDWGMDSFIPTVERVAYNNELQKYMESQVTIKDRHIILTADKTKDEYLSGKVVSNVAFQYGTLAFKVKKVRETGLFPAIWMLPLDAKIKSEVDIYEAIGSEDYRFYGVYHWYEKERKNRDYFKFNYPDNENLSACIRFEWDKDSMEWYYNDQLIYRITKHVPNYPMYLIMNLAVGGEWAKEPNQSTMFPTSFDVEIIEFSPDEIIPR